MQNLEPSSPIIFDTDLPPEELEHILQRIDENLALRSFFEKELTGADSRNRIDEMQSPPILSNLKEYPNFYYPLSLIRNSQAPYYAVEGNVFIRFIKRLLNLPILIFGRKQAYFNRLALEIWELITSHLSDLWQHNKAGIDVINSLNGRLEQMKIDFQNQRSQLESLVTEQNSHRSQLESLVAEQNSHRSQLESLAAERENQHKWMENITGNQDDINKWMGGLAANQDGINKWMENLSANQDGTSKWIDVVARKLEMLALDVREGMATPKIMDTGLPDPIIVDPERYAQRLSEMKGNIKVNLGCGEKPWPDYLNVDLRHVPDVDIMADARNIPFETGTLSEIASAHLFEHFREHESLVRILPYWKSLLKPGGIVRIICPNWAAMLEQLNSGKMTLARFKQLTFGSQDYQCDDHFAMYTPETLSGLLRETGFGEIQVLSVDRDNGGCPEMELVATKSN